MGRRNKIYTDKTIMRIRIMQQAGKTTAEIAEEIGTTRERLSMALHRLGLGRKALGIPVKYPLGVTCTVTLPYELNRAFEEPAKQRGVTPQKLIRRLLDIIVRDNLLRGILDDE